MDFEPIETSKLRVERDRFLKQKRYRRVAAIDEVLSGRGEHVAPKDLKRAKARLRKMARSLHQRIGDATELTKKRDALEERSDKMETKMEASYDAEAKKKAGSK